MKPSNKKISIQIFKFYSIQHLYIYILVFSLKKHLIFFCTNSNLKTQNGYKILINELKSHNKKVQSWNKYNHN